LKKYNSFECLWLLKKNPVHKFLTLKKLPFTCLRHLKNPFDVSLAITNPIHMSFPFEWHWFWWSMGWEGVRTGKCKTESRQLSTGRVHGWSFIFRQLLQRHCRLLQWVLHITKSHKVLHSQWYMKKRLEWLCYVAKTCVLFRSYQLNHNIRLKFPSYFFNAQVILIKSDLVLSQ